MIDGIPPQTRLVDLERARARARIDTTIGGAAIIVNRHGDDAGAANVRSGRKADLPSLIHRRRGREQFWLIDRYLETNMLRRFIGRARGDVFGESRDTDWPTLIDGVQVRSVCKAGGNVGNRRLKRANID